MGRKVNIVRPNGTVFTGTEEELANLQLLGEYKEEATDEATTRLVEERRAEKADTVEAKVGAALSGYASGMTLGGTDLLRTEVLGGEANPDYIKYNPGYRMAGEITGAITGSIAPVNPAGFVTAGANAAGKAVGGGALGLAAAGAIEGAGGGLQATIANATLNNDPITAESIRSGIGYGALLGGGIAGGIGIAGKGLAKIGDKLYKAEAPATREVGVALDGFETRTVTKKLPKIEATEHLTDSVLDRKEIKTLLRPVDETSYNSLRDVVNEMSVKGYAMGGEFETALKEAEGAFKLANKTPTAAEFKSALAGMNAASDDIGSYAFLQGMAGKEVGVMRTVGSAALRAVDAGDFVKAREALKTYQAAIKKVESITGYSAATLPPIPGFAEEAKTSLKAAIDSSKRVVETRAAANALDSFPKSVDGFINMSPEKAEKLFAALDNVVTNGGDELHPIRAALEAAATDMATKSGIKAEGSTVDVLRQVWAAGKLGKTTEKIDIVEKLIQKDRENKVWLEAFEDVEEDVPVKIRGRQEVPVDAKKAGHHYGIAEQIQQHAVAASAAGMVGGPLAPVVYYGTKHLMQNPEGLAAMKNVVQNRIARAAQAAGKAMQSAKVPNVSARLEALYMRYDGTPDKDTKKADMKELAKRRITELVEAAPAAKNMMYKQIEPLIGQHAELGAAVLNSAIQGFNALIEMLPKDPGVAFNGMKSLWKPNDVQAAQTAKMLRAFHFPVAVIEDAMRGDIDPIEISTLKRVNPEMYTMMRGMALENIDFSDMDYRDQAKYSILLDVDVHSSFTPQSIAEAQRVFQEIPEQGKSGKSGGANGRPPKTEPPTPGQSIAEGRPA